MRSHITILLSFCVLTLVGCQGAAEKVGPMEDCVSFCMGQKASGADLSDGPCLSNTIASDWVCDVAHSPRQNIDNDPANQCPAFRDSIAHHFAEVDTDCKPIRAV